MRKNHFLVLIISGLLGGLAFTACKKDDVADPDNTDNTTYQTTPFGLTLPTWVDDSLGAMPGSSEMTVEGVALGRKLFYDEKLSGDMTQSCASCHKQSDAFDDVRRFSVGITGAVGDRNAMSIQNLAWRTKFFWDGRSPSLEAQAHDPVVNPIEMNATWPQVLSRLNADEAYKTAFKNAFNITTIDSTDVTKALAQFERTLVSFSSRADAYNNGNTTALNAAEIRGKALYFGKARCATCHNTATFTDNQFRNNGLDAAGAPNADLGMGHVTGNASDNGKMLVPPLRNIARTAPYMHDGRFANLNQVLAFYAGQVQANSPNLDSKMQVYLNGPLFTPQEAGDIIAYLTALSDDGYLANQATSDPE